MKKTSRLWLLALALALVCACLPLAASATGTQGTQNTAAAGYAFAATKASTLATPKLSKVENVTAGVKITWGKVSGAAKYRVFYKAGKGGWKKLADTTKTSYTWTKAKSGTKYAFTVRCISKDGKKYTSAYNKAGKSITYIAAPKVTKLQSTASGVKITWGKVAGAAKYRVFGKTSGGSWKKLGDTTATSYTWKGAKNGTKYAFTVRCLSKDGKKYTSGYDTAGKAGTYKKPASTLATPKLSKVENVAGGVKVTWGKVAGAAKYRVFGKTSSGSWKTLGDTTGTSYTWKKAKSGTKYAFTVRCLSADSKKYTSAYDTTGKAITYIAAPAISKLESTATGVSISWGKVAGAARYRVFYKTGSGSWTKAGDTTSTSYTWTKAKNNTKYTFTVRCLSKDGKSYTSAYDTAGKAITYKAPASGGSTGGAVAINATNFPDAAFRSYLSSYYDWDRDGALSAAECAAVTRIDVYGCDVATLKGVEHFANLNYLDCGDSYEDGPGKLTALDVSKNTKLLTLYCSGNQLTTLDVSKNTALEDLDCSANELAELDVSKNTKLKILDCSDNELKTLDVGGATALEGLYCHGNQLAELDVGRNTKLKYFDCNGNQLAALDVRGCAVLEHLVCFDNRLAALDVSKNTQLQELSCYRNQLTALDVGGATALTKLDCYENQLAELDVSRNTALVFLQCFHNRLTALDVSKNTALGWLACSENRLTTLDTSNNKKLSNLACDDNSLATLNVGQNTQLQELYCENNQLKTLDVSGATGLQILYCRGNPLPTLDVSKNAKLEKLACDNIDNVIGWYI